MNLTDKQLAHLKVVATGDVKGSYMRWEMHFFDLATATNGERIMPLETRTMQVLERRGLVEWTLPSDGTASFDVRATAAGHKVVAA